MRFRTYLTLALASAALVPFLALSWLERADIARTIDASDHEQLEEVHMAGLLLKERLGFVNHIATFAKEEFAEVIPAGSTAALERRLAQIVDSFPLLHNLHVDRLNEAGRATVLAFHSHDEAEMRSALGADHSARWHAVVARSRNQETVHYSPVILSSHGTPTPLITFAISDAQSRFIISGALVFERLFDDLRASLLQKGLHLTVLDAGGAIIYPHKSHESIQRWTGSLENFSVTNDAELGALFVTTGRLKAVSATLPDWTIIVARSQAKRLSEQSALALRTALFALLLLALTLLAGWFGARPIGEALERLMLDLDDRHFGSAHSLVNTGPEELRALQERYRAMRQALDERAAELRNINASLSSLVEARSLELTAQARLFEAVFNEMDDAALLLDTTEALQAENPSATAMLTADLREQLLSAVHERLHQPNTERRMTLTAQEEPNRTLEVSWFAFTAPHAGLRDGWCLLVRDITARAQLEQMKSDLIGIVAHELKTPLTTSRLALEQLIAQEPERAALLAMRTDLEHLERLITDWLKVVKIDGGGLEVHPEVLQLAPLISRAKRLVRSRYDFTLTVDIAEEAELIRADATAMIEVFVNLFSNACRNARPGESADITFTARRTDKAIELACIDHGVGIPPKERELIFERFHQVVRGNRRPSGGTGLGLVITRAIIRAHGGEIIATSREAATVLLITLPLPEHALGEQHTDEGEPCH